MADEELIEFVRLENDRFAPYLNGNFREPRSMIPLCDMTMKKGYVRLRCTL